MFTYVNWWRALKTAAGCSPIVILVTAVLAV